MPHQVLMGMPLRPRPTVPVPSGLPAVGSEMQSMGQAVPQLVPAVAQPAKVQPAKLTVYNQFTNQVRRRRSKALLLPDTGFDSPPEIPRGRSPAPLPTERWQGAAPGISPHL